MKYLLLSILLVGCTQGNWAFDANGNLIPEVSQPSPQSPSTMRLRNISAVDANGEELGNVLSAGKKEITLISTLGFIYDISWDGALKATTIYYSGAGCTGTPYFNLSNEKYSSLSLFIDGDQTLLSSTNNTTNGVAVVIPSGIVTLSAYKDQVGGCYSNSGSGNVIELSPLARETAGIPSLIQGPLTLEEN